MGIRKRAGRALGITVVAYAALTAANLGEFWPFSIYPMFSQGANPWSRAVVRDVSQVASPIRWEELSVSELPGDPYPLTEHGVDPIDLANFVSKTRIWDEARVDALRRMFGEQELLERSLLVVRANGRISEDDSVGVSFVPYALLTNRDSELNADLPRSATE